MYYTDGKVVMRLRLVLTTWDIFRWVIIFYVWSVAKNIISALFLLPKHCLQVLLKILLPCVCFSRVL